MSTIDKQTPIRRLAILIISIILSTISLFAQSTKIQVLELRNYLLKPGQRDYFIDSFEIKIMDTLNARGNYVLGQYRVKDAPETFFGFVALMI